MSYYVDDETFIFSITSYECEVKKYQITFEITDWKNEKKNYLYFILYTILYRNINKKALKRLHFFDSVVFQEQILILSPSTYIRVGLKVE